MKMKCPQCKAKIDKKIIFCTFLRCYFSFGTRFANELYRIVFHRLSFRLNNMAGSKVNEFDPAVLFYIGPFRPAFLISMPPPPQRCFPQ